MAGTPTIGPATYDWKFVRGDTATFAFRLWDSVYDSGSDSWIKGNALNLTGYSFLAQWRADEKKDAALVAAVTATVPDQSILANRGFVFLSVAASVTINLGAATLVGKDFVKIGAWDCEVTEPASGPVTTIWAGDIYIRPDVSRVP